MSMFPWFSMERASLKHHSLSNAADGDALTPLLTDAPFAAGRWYIAIKIRLAS